MKKPAANTDDERDQAEGVWNNEGGAALDPEKMEKREREDLERAEENFERVFGGKKKHHKKGKK